jgi:hypothetical protein
MEAYLKGQPKYQYNQALEAAAEGKCLESLVEIHSPKRIRRPYTPWTQG